MVYWPPACPLVIVNIIQNKSSYTLQRDSLVSECSLLFRVEVLYIALCIIFIIIFVILSWSAVYSDSDDNYVGQTQLTL